MIHYEEGSKTLFIGDSITDCGRDRNNSLGLGGGYVQMLAARLGTAFAELNPVFMNRGISGNRVKDLRDRWDKDCLSEQPDVLSIYIGINDTWRRFDSNDPTSPEKFEEDYRHILEAARRSLGSCQIVMVEPFVLPVPSEKWKWREDLDPKISVTRKLALEFADAYVPLDGVFAAACCRQEPSFWAGDGVHPSNAGHNLIAEAWLSYTGLT
ncbi:MAG: GDSL family lipase [Lentisphaerae bacterium GWF2_52_8]|nr:MAG: GDSL family lipase [Lentisphaerae bacterium GWF2_52_8]